MQSRTKSVGPPPPDAETAALGAGALGALPPVRAALADAENSKAAPATMTNSD
jgi:hypothetical protein